MQNARPLRQMKESASKLNRNARRDNTSQQGSSGRRDEVAEQPVIRNAPRDTSQQGSSGREKRPEINVGKTLGTQRSVPAWQLVELM